jgi:hypothetical protein
MGRSRGQTNVNQPSADTELPLRWIDVTGCDRSKLERVRKRLDLPRAFVWFSQARFLYPMLLDLPPTCLLATFLSTPSAHHVFRTEPLHIWLMEHAVITVTPKLCMNKTFPSVQESTSDRSFLSRLLEAVLASHEDVVQSWNDTLAASVRERGRCHWHEKGRRARVFVRLLERQMYFFDVLGAHVASLKMLRDRLEGLLNIARCASERLHKLERCPSCGQATLASRSGAPDA